MRMTRVAVLLLMGVGCAAPDVTGPLPLDDGGVPATFGPTHQGSYHLGPVDFAETHWANSCAPYPVAIREKTGVYLAGVDTSLNGNGSLCDACALVTTRLGKQVLVRIITTGTSKAPGDMDLSPQAYAAIHEEDPQGTDSNPRPMAWQLARCADLGPVVLQYQTEANPYWTSLWVRNGRLPIDTLEVKSKNHASFFSLRRETDGTFNDDSGFGEEAFTLRITGRGGVTTEQQFNGFEPGALVTSQMRVE